MPVSFEATEVSVATKHEVLVIRLSAPSTEQDDFYLMFQHKEHYSEQDAKWGMNEPYVEFCGQGWSWYGHMLKVHLMRNVIRVEMNSEAAAHMRNDGILEVGFNLNDERFAGLQSALRETFRSVGYYTHEG
jgi:hypothetical protein